MANPARLPGKHGALPRSQDSYVPVFDHYLRRWEGPLAAPAGLAGAGPPAGASPDTLPAAPGDTDRESLVSDWPMYVNGPDPANPAYAPGGLGDCTIAGPAHAFTAQRAYAGYYQPHFEPEAIVSAYSACGGYVKGDPGTDLGCDPLVVLRYLATEGLTDTAGFTHKLAAYAVFADPRNTALMAQVLAAYGTVGIAFTCDTQFEDAFSAGAPVTWRPGSPAVGGHFVVLQRRRAGGVGVLEEVTWGAVARVTKGYHWHQVQDVYVMFSEDYLRAGGTSCQGLDMAQLLSDMTSVS